MNPVDPKNRAATPVHAADSKREQRARPTLGPVARQVAEQYRRDTMSPVMVSGVMRIIEFCVLLLPGFAIYAGHVGLSTHLSLEYPLVIAGVSLLSVILFEFSDAYQMPALRNPMSHAGRIFLCWSSSFAVLLVALFFLKISEEFSRLWLGAWFASGLGVVFVLRLVTSRVIRRWTRNGRIERRAVIVGGGKNAELLIRSIERQPYNDIRICGIFDDRDDRRSPPIVAGYPKLGNVDELIEFARIARIDMMIVSLPITAEARVLTMLRKLWVLPIDIRLSAHSSHMRFRPRAYSYIGSVPMLDVLDRPINDWDSVAKRAFDILFSLLGIVVFSPVMLATAIAIKLDSKGPVLFRQKRHGFNNEEINVFKFRSMYIEQCDPTARNLVTKDDPRVTRVGRFIRKTSIDELPQFFNSLSGSLSLVGPRPHAPTAKAENRLYDEVVDGYFARHRVKPGVTGWAQINGWRGETDTEEKIRKRTEFDLYYIENWSLWFDLKILLLTPFRLLGSDNAY
ncbi:undecaprenyl-phosphate glucose phosphotransferase [Chelativorans sp. YIM 93263]|uniref:undecaprenyl-phosphate glucose phosphotransferase n=1 Tax=Chelativorans sp. YIM 93263 TaxID=2906648 RepID=UPI00237862D4|nr:undecaprenyl-phosphate glucose phosphotransferase [Chelativorans sp. YIM 93263]